MPLRQCKRLLLRPGQAGDPMPQALDEVLKIEGRKRLILDDQDIRGLKPACDFAVGRGDEQSGIPIPQSRTAAISSGVNPSRVRSRKCLPRLGRQGLQVQQSAVFPGVEIREGVGIHGIPDFEE